jgi:DNA anti-recombination protein RmuC
MAYGFTHVLRENLALKKRRVGLREESEKLLIEMRATLDNRFPDQAAENAEKVEEIRKAMGL